MQVDLVTTIGIGMACLFAGLVVGLRMRRKPAPGATGDAGTESTRDTKKIDRDEYDEPENELWEQLLDTCYHDFRVQAAAGRDRDFFPTLHEPLFVDPQISMDSPLLPGEITVTDVYDVHAFGDVWKGRRLEMYDATSELPLEERQFVRQLLEDLLVNIGSYPTDVQAFRLVVRTPGHQHEVLLSHDLKRVLGVIPGDATLRGNNL